MKAFELAEKLMEHPDTEVITMIYYTDIGDEAPADILPDGIIYDAAHNRTLIKVECE